MVQVSIEYGPTGGALLDQLNDQGHTIDNPDKWEELRVSALRLSLAGVLTEHMAKRTFERLHNSIMKNVKELKH